MKDLSAPGTYSPDDPGGGPYNEKTGIRDWYHPSASEMFSSVMAHLRRREGLTQTELAEKVTAASPSITIYDSTVAKIETGKRKINLDEAATIARVLGVNLAYMTGYDYPPDLRQWIEDQHQQQLQPRRTR